VSNPCFYIRWPYKEVDYTLDLDNALDFEYNALDLDDTLGFEDNAVNSGDSAVYSEDYTLGDYWNRNKNKNSIFLVLKQISKEALDILYRDNIFKLRLYNKGEYYLAKNFTEANRQRIRYLLLTAQPSSVSYKLGRTLDNVL
jgi:hypothetical protein